MATRRAGYPRSGVGALAAALLVLTACGQAPGGLRGELARQAGESAAAVSSALRGLDLWVDSRFGQPQMRVLLADMVGQAVTAQGAVAAINASASASERDTVLTELSAATVVLVRIRSAVDDGKDATQRLRPELTRARDRLSRLADDPTTALTG